MSITVRLWSPEELRNVKTDKWLATLLMNHTTFSQEELTALLTIPKKYNKVYHCYWYADPLHDDPIVIKATDEKMLAQFIDAEYTRRPDEIYQVITQYRPVTL